VTVTEGFIKMVVFIALNAHYGKVTEATSLCAKRQHITTDIQKNGNMTRKKVERRLKISELAQAVIDMNNLTETMSKKLREFYEAYKEVHNKQMEITEMVTDMLKETM
jgi:type IV pilus biogenesis protein CpaD/CtpE